MRDQHAEGAGEDDRCQQTVQDHPRTVLRKTTHSHCTNTHDFLWPQQLCSPTAMASLSSAAPATVERAPRLLLPHLLSTRRALSFVHHTLSIHSVPSLSSAATSLSARRALASSRPASVPCHWPCSPAWACLPALPRLAQAQPDAAVSLSFLFSHSLPFSLPEPRCCRAGRVREDWRKKTAEGIRGLEEGGGRRKGGEEEEQKRKSISFILSALSLILILLPLPLYLSHTSSSFFSPLMGPMHSPGSASSLLSEIGWGRERRRKKRRRRIREKEGEEREVHLLFSISPTPWVEE